MLIYYVFLNIRLHKWLFGRKFVPKVIALLDVFEGRVTDCRVFRRGDIARQRLSMIGVDLVKVLKDSSA